MPAMEHFDVEPVAGYPQEYGLMLAILEDGTREWMGEIGEPSEDAIVWQPVTGGYSIGAILLHIAYVEVAWFESGILGRKISDKDAALYMVDETDVDNGVWPVPPRKPWAWYKQLLHDARARTFKSVLDFPDPASSFQGRTSTMTCRWTVGHVIQHDSYHGGQAVLLAMLHEHLK